MCLDENNVMPLPSEIHLLQSMINFLKEQVQKKKKQKEPVYFSSFFVFSSNNVDKIYFNSNVIEILISTNANSTKISIILFSNG